MKRFYFLLPLLCSIQLVFSQSTEITLVQEDEQGLVLRVKPGKAQFKNIQTPEGQAWSVSLDQGTPILEKGSPELPKLAQSLIIPKDARMVVEILDMKVNYLENMPIVPSKGNLYRNVNPADVPLEYGAVYQQDAFYPQEIVSLREPYVLRDFQGQTVVVNPIRFNPQTNQLVLIEEITIALRPAEGSLQSPTPLTGRINKTFDEIYRHQFLNYKSTGADYDPVNDWGNMLIVAHDAYLDAMIPYQQWKMEKGIPTDLVAMSAVGSDENALLDYVTNYYNDRGLTFLLLVGDENTIPTIMVNYGGLYSCDNCFSYMAGDDHYPDMFTGRFNAETLQQVQTMVDRALQYEKNPDRNMADWFGTGIGIGSNEGQGIGDDGEADWQHQNKIKEQLLNYTYSSVYEYYDGSHANDSPTPGDVSADANGSPNANMINTQIQTVGASIMNYTGHGWEQGVATGSYDVNAVNNMDYNGAYPFFIAVACCTGDFTDNAGGDCLGEAWIRATDNATGAPTGGIGGLFASIFQSWAPPMEAQDEMINIITDSVPYQTRHILGGIAANGMASMNDAYGGGGWEMTDTWNFFGDPSIVLWTKSPDTLLATHLASTPIGTSTFQVNCNVAGALISVFQTSQLLGTGIADSSGNATIFFDDPVSSIDKLTVTATAHNYLPYQGPVDILVEGPYVVLENYLVDDAAGNADGEVDFGETISMHIALENIGLDTAYEVIASISCADTSITLFDDSDSWGTIGAGAIADKNNAFGFQVAEVIQDQQVASFVITASDSSGNTFETPFKINLNAPKLAVTTIRVLDSLNGNNNGRLDAGEVATIIVNNANSGHSQSPEAIGNLLTSSPWLTLLNNSWSIGTIDKLSQVIVEARFDVEVSTDVPVNSSADFDYAVAAGDYGADRTFTLPINLLAIDFENQQYDSTFTWVADENYPWYLSDDRALEGIYSSKSGNIPNNKSSEMILQVEVLEEGDLSFYYAVSSEPEYDFLYFYLDGVEMSSWSGEADWTEYTAFLPVGNHELRWVYKKDEIFSQGEDAAWVDFITLPLVNSETPDNTSFLSLNPGQFAIYPNPLAHSAVIEYELEQSSPVTLVISNQLGQRLEVLTSGTQATGTHQFEWNTSNLSKGSYYVELQAGDHKKVIQVIKP